MKNKSNHSQSYLTQKYKSLVDQNFNAVFTLDLNNHITEANLVCMQLTKYSADELIGMSFETLINFEYKKKMLEPFKDATQGEPSACETVIDDKDGNSIDVLIKYIPIIIDGGNVGVYCIVMDISVEKRMKKALAESQEQYRRLSDHSPEAIIIHSEGTIEYANGAAADLVDIKGGSEQLIGKSIYDFHPLSDRNKIKSNIQDITDIDNSQKSELQEEKVVTVDGEEIIVEVLRMKTIFKGVPAIHSVFRDVTERKKLEQELEESQHMYQLITENSRDLIQLLDVDGKITYASPSHDKILGITPESCLGRLLENFLNVDDRLIYLGIYKEMLEEKEHRLVELRLKHHDRSYIWVEIDLTPIKNEAGDVTEVLLVGENITERKHHEEKIRQMAFYDGLTNLPNRSLLKEHANKALALAKRNKHQLAIVYLDCDDFKPVNDELGHDAGDEYLKALADILINCVRENDTVARVGGDEFNLLLVDIEHRHDIQGVIERILEKIQKPLMLKGREININVSMGIAIYPTDDQDIDSLIKKADKAMYAAKECGKNGFKWYV